MERFEGNFTQQEPLSEEAIEAAVAVMRGSRLHRYNLLSGEVGEVALLEAEYAAWQGAKYCLALASGGQAMQMALRAAEVQSGDPVLTNAFTLAPVPGAIEAVGARAVLVEVNENLTIDLDDLERKIEASRSRFLLLSHMRGHLCDMDRLSEICAREGVLLIEDCAHTMGAKWNGERSGNFGLAGCFSTQTYKHLNSGEGGLLTSDDAEFMARAIILSGSYMLYERHGARPDLDVFERVKFDMPNCSARMDAIRAAILRVELRGIDDKIARWNALYSMLEGALADLPDIHLPHRPNEENIVGSSLQFRVPALDESGCRALVNLCAKRGVELKWFGEDAPRGFTSNHKSWRYIAAQELPETDRILSTLFDLRLSLVFEPADCLVIGKIVRESLGEVMSARPAP